MMWIFVLKKSQIHKSMLTVNEIFHSFYRWFHSHISGCSVRGSDRSGFISVRSGPSMHPKKRVDVFLTGWDVGISSKSVSC